MLNHSQELLTASRVRDLIQEGSPSSERVPNKDFPKYGYKAASKAMLDRTDQILQPTANYFYCCKK